MCFGLRRPAATIIGIGHVTLDTDGAISKFTRKRRGVEKVGQDDLVVPGQSYGAGAPNVIRRTRDDDYRFLFEHNTPPGEG
jgi:hypothetical protein